MIERLPCVPDDRGASCADIPDAMSFQNVAREWARDQRRSVSEQAIFHHLLQAFWRGEFERRNQPHGEVESLVFTLEVPRGTSEDQPYSVTHDGHVLKKVVDEATGRERSVATSQRQPLFWTRQEFLRFIASFWDETASTRLANFETQEEALQFMAACSVEDYPAIPRTLVERLHISRTALEKAARVARLEYAASKSRRPKSAESRRRGPPEKPCWRWIYPRVLDWLEEEGEPDKRVEVERYIERLLAERNEYAAESTLQRHADRCIRRTPQTPSGRHLTSGICRYCRSNRSSASRELCSALTAAGRRRLEQLLMARDRANAITERVADTVNEFCDALRIGRTLFYSEVKAGRIKILKVGRKSLVPRSEREAWLRRLAGQEN